MNGMMYSILKKYDLLSKQDDWIDLCYIGYTKALNSYNNSKKASFDTYAYVCMENEVKDELKKLNRKKRQREELSLDYFIQDNFDNYELIPDKVNVEEEVLCNENTNTIKKVIKDLDNEEKLYLTELYINNLNKKEIIDKYKIGIHPLNKILESAYQKLKDSKAYLYLM